MTQVVLTGGTGKLGAVGFCFGGGVVNTLAVRMGTALDAGVPRRQIAAGDGVVDELLRRRRLRERKPEHGGEEIQRDEYSRLLS